MEKLVVILIFMTTIFVLASCTTTYDKDMMMSDAASFSASPHYMWTRPTEIAYEIIGDVEGTAEYSLLFGFIPLGDAPKLEFNLFGNQATNNPGVKLAAYDACKTVGADGIYIISVYTESKQGFFVDSELVTVTGKALKLVDLGTVDQKRADTIAYLNALNGNFKQDNLAPNVDNDGAFGSLGDIFTFGF